MQVLAPSNISQQKTTTLAALTRAFVLTSPSLSRLLPLAHVCSFGGMSGCRNLPVLMCWRDAASGLAGDRIPPCLCAVPPVALGPDRPFSQPWLCLPLLSRSNISSPTSARPKRYFCYKPLQNKQAMAGKGDKQEGRDTRGGWDAAKPLKMGRPQGTKSRESRFALWPPCTVPFACKSGARFGSRRRINQVRSAQSRVRGCSLLCLKN